MICILCECEQPDTDDRPEAHLLGCPDDPFWARYPRIRRLLRIAYDAGGFNRMLIPQARTVPKALRARPGILGACIALSAQLGWEMDGPLYRPLAHAA